MAQRLPDFVAQGQEKIRELDQETSLGFDKNTGEEMLQGGQELRRLAGDLRSVSKGNRQDEALLAADYLELRGLGYEGSGLLTKTLGGIKAISMGIPTAIIRLGEHLAAVDPTKFRDAVSAAHGLKVQAQIALGIFYYRSPKPIQDLDRAVEWLREAIAESPRNPAQPENPVHPVLPRLYLVKALRKLGKGQEGKKILAEVKDLLAKPLSPYEDHLEDYLVKIYRDLAS